MDAPTSMPNGKSALAERLHQMIDEADRFLKSAAVTGDEKYDTVRTRIADQARQMRAQLDELDTRARSSARYAARVTDRTLHEHPYSAIGVAALAGLLIGYLITTRR
jgi:ElaB/YqjD/DUF883 family membrane-anchored ribosome-binding protein